jgi:stage V sporulation protein G
MKITEVRIFPTESRDGKLKAFATVTFDDWFVVRNVKVIQGNSGLFVAMPSRKAMDPCVKCNFKNVRGSKYCNQCGTQLPQAEADEDGSRNAGNHMDIAHPITQECRVYIQDSILDQYKKEKDRQKTEGKSYRPVSEEDLNTVSDKFTERNKVAGKGGAPESTGAGDARDIEL